MKRPKSKVFKHHKDLIKAAVGGIEPRVEAKRQAITDHAEAEKKKDEAWVKENRLVLEINARANNELM